MLTNHAPRYKHKVSKTLTTEAPPEKGGGILADEMGMGKTLTMIALIIQLLSEAHQLAAETRSSGQYTGAASHFAHSTLVIVPSECRSEISMTDTRNIPSY